MYSHLVIGTHFRGTPSKQAEVKQTLLKEESEENQLHAEIRDPVPPNPTSSGGPSQDVIRGPATSHTPHHYDNVVLED